LNSPLSTLSHQGVRQPGCLPPASLSHTGVGSGVVQRRLASGSREIYVDSQASLDNTQYRHSWPAAVIYSLAPC